MKVFSYIVKHTIAVLLSSLSITALANESTPERTSADRQVIVQMNYCINSLTNIINNQSIEALDYELDQLVNNLTMDQIKDMPEIANFRVNLLDKISNLSINTEERNLYRRIQDLRNSRQKWEAISSALNNVILIGSSVMSQTQQVNGKALAVQLVGYGLLTAARASIEYKNIQYKNDIEELQALWEFRKNEMHEVKQLRKEALECQYELYHKYRLKESDRLTESLALNFNRMISYPDPNKRIRDLTDNQKYYQTLPEYFYYLGMSYIDIFDYQKAKPFLDIYEKMYEEAPIFKVDPKSGLVALARLSFEQNLSSTEKKSLIDKVLDNLPSNSSAWIQCALIYLNDLNSPTESINILRRALDSHNITEKDLVVMTLAKLMPIIDTMPELKNEVVMAFEECNNLSINSTIAFIAASNANSLWRTLNNYIGFNDLYKPQYLLSFFGTAFENDFIINNNKNLSVNPDNIHVYVENHSAEIIDIVEDLIEFDGAISIDKINKISAFRRQPKLKYVFFESLYKDTYFKLRDNLDKNKIKSGELLEMQPFNLEKSAIEDILDFIEDYEADKLIMNLHIEQIKKGKTSYKKEGLPYFDAAFKEQSIKKAETSRYTPGKLFSPRMNYKFTGDSLVYVPMPFRQQNGTYIKICFDGIVPVYLTYRLNNDTHDADIYSAEINGTIAFANEQRITKFMKAAPKEENNIIKKAKEEASVAIDKTKSANESVKKQTEEAVSSVLSKIKGWFD